MRSPILALLLLLGGCVFFGPSYRAPSTETVTASPERLARGAYLAVHVAGCIQCHSPHQTDRFALPRIAGQDGGGDACFEESFGFPGQVCPPNISSHPTAGIGAWSDGELLRAMREGVDRNGDTLFPFMPYPDFREMSDEDARAIVAYIRTLPPIDRTGPRTDIDFPVSMFIRAVPEPLEALVPDPDRKDTVAYGEYLTTLAGCTHCHTQMKRGKPLEGMLMAGGTEFKTSWVHVRAPNITRDNTGIGTMSRESFIARFKAFASPETAVKVRPEEQTIMPWLDYAGMTEEDLGAIFDYLRTLPAVVNEVEKRGAITGTPPIPPGAK